MFTSVTNLNQWGGTTYAWDSGPIIALFVVFGVTLLAFIASQAWLGENGTGMRFQNQNNNVSSC